ncbi:MAG TPA: peptide deformylase [Chroococcales cyanobacterium]|jgi:peptide deformylase
MMPLSYFGSEVLREPAQPVIKVSAEIKKLIEEMFETNKAANGVGLAAPQVGVGKRVVIIDLSHTGIEPFALVNPVLSRCRGCAEDSEGCLSLPGIFLPVPRFEKISVRARDEKGRSIVIDAEGFLARVIQHELDHLDGKLFIDHVEDKEAVERELLALKDRLAQIALTGKWEQDDE